MIPASLSRYAPILCCPVCRGALAWAEASVQCSTASCGRTFPIISDVPILIREENSLFRLEDFIRGPVDPRSGHALKHRRQPREVIKRLLPRLSWNPYASHRYQRLADELSKREGRPNILVVGGAVLGKGMDTLVAQGNIDVVETDIRFGSRTTLICDGHDLPFEDGSLDCVVIQAVLEHVVDPRRCVEEIHRVLKRDGLVYAETPFMQQVHEGAYDFTRFTLLGHRRLFRQFEQIMAGPVGGPGTVLGWSYQYFLTGFANSRRSRGILTMLARLTGFWFKYFDIILLHHRGAQDGAWGCYFMGRKSSHTLPDRELVKLYAGIL